MAVNDLLSLGVMSFEYDVGVMSFEYDDGL